MRCLIGGLVAVVLLARSTISVSAQELTTISLRFLRAPSFEPVAGVQVFLMDASGAVVAAAETDVHGNVEFAVRPQGYIMSVEGRIPPGLPLQLNPLYDARGGLPLFATPDQPDSTFWIDQAGMVEPAPPTDRDTGSQEAIAPAATPMAPVELPILATSASQVAAPLAVPTETPWPAGSSGPSHSPGTAARSESAEDDWLTVLSWTLSIVTVVLLIALWAWSRLFRSPKVRS